MRFAVTGCAGSGTRYIANLLTECGASTAHERVFKATYGSDSSLDDHEGESSHAAAAYLPIDGTVGVHLIRPPLDVVASIVARGLLRGGGTRNFRPFVERHVGSTGLPAGSELAAWYWLTWNRLAASRTETTWRIHRLSADDVMWLSHVAELKLDGDHVARALATTSRVGASDRGNVNLNDLGEYANRVYFAARRYDVPLRAE